MDADSMFAEKVGRLVEVLSDGLMLIPNDRRWKARLRAEMLVVNANSIEAIVRFPNTNFTGQSRVRGEH